MDNQTRHSGIGAWTAADADQGKDHMLEVIYKHALQMLQSSSYPRQLTLLRAVYDAAGQQRV